MLKFTTKRKITALVTAIAVTCIAFSGCGNTASDKDEQGRTVISIGSYPAKEGKSRDTWDAKWQKFEQDNSDVKVEPDTWTFDLKTFYAKAAGNQLPNLFVTHFTEIGQCIDAGYVGDLTEALNKRNYQGKFNDKILDIISDDDGNIFAFPVSTYVLGIGYNVEMFEAAGLMEADGTPKQPATWDELREFAVKIKEATGKPGFVFPTSENNGGWMFTCLAWSFGTDFMEQDADGKWKATFNSPEAAEALQYIKDLKWKYDVLPSNNLINNSEYYKLYATGNAGMLMAAGSMPSSLTKYEMNPENIGMFAMPAGPKRHVTLLGGTVYSVSKNSTPDQIDAAIRWLEASYNYNATEDFKLNKQREIDVALENNQLIGIKSMKPWSGEAESVQYEYDLINKYANGNPNHFRLYNEFVENGTAEIQPEEPVCAQELYSVLDSCIQEVLTDENADCAAILEKANNDFQVNYLDNLAY
ncbi:MAG: extracellular solute-binding protein [Clostridia bacterium]|nr:extracellular solute-binding protein [Clostridia bacterium]